MRRTFMIMGIIVTILGAFEYHIEYSMGVVLVLGGMSIMSATSICFPKKKNDRKPTLHW